MLAFGLTACSTSPNGATPPISSGQSQVPQDQITQDQTASGQTTLDNNTRDSIQPPQVNSPESRPNLPVTAPLTRENLPLALPQSNNFDIAFSDYLPGWNETSLVPAITAFANNCPIWEAREHNKDLLMGKPEFGDYSHWQALCSVLPPAPYNEDLARWFFESYFLPSNLLTADRLEGLLTGYYEPEINVRSHLDAEFSEPILAKPESDRLRLQSRGDIYRNQVDYTALAYGRPIDVSALLMDVLNALRMAGIMAVNISPLAGF